MLGEFDPVHFGHDDIGQQQVESVAFDVRQRLRPGGDRHDVIALPLQRAREINPHAFIVFRQKNPNHRPQPVLHPNRRPRPVYAVTTARTCIMR
jgi:FAD synthase